MSAAPRLSSNILAKKRRFSYQHKNLSQSMFPFRVQYLFLIYRLQGLTKGLSQNSGIGNDDQAFRELQQYADFQSVLSQRLCAEIDMDEPVYQSIDPQLLEKGHVAGPNLTPGHIHPALQTPISHHGLRSPVVIAAKTRNHEIEGWERAYAPSLMECGIDQNTFLHFIDTFNDTIQVLFWHSESSHSANRSTRISLPSEMLMFKSTNLLLKRKLQSSSPSAIPKIYYPPRPNLGIGKWKHASNI
jgi:hypothetical protein